MPVGRILRKSISDSKKMARLKTDGARLLYTWLLAHLDINGCFSGDPTVVKGKVFTRLNKSVVTINRYLQDLNENCLIVIYEVDEDLFLHVPDFVSKQPNLRPERESSSDIPLPPKELLHNSCTTPAKLRSSPAQEKLREVKLREVKKDKENPASLNFVCPLKNPQVKDETVLATKIKEKLKFKSLGTKELQAYFNHIWMMCYFVAKRWHYKGCGEKELATCNEFLDCCFADLKDAVNAGRVNGWKPAYFKGIVEKTINEDGEMFFKQKK